ncbi:hypothetical protein [Streptomyces sp. SPB4]|uniref:hypothetical protein n=1 Tax=Streptomyces sp. SPB4 TaxID=2940553 RepID=UPI002473900A|nr:hypothetical protein [Streptomyces sp. SPB4]MDH6545560.1 hypothetical protein [Streptomyces sp. SPB4]
MPHTDYPLTTEGLFRAEAALRALLNDASDRTISPEAERELASRAAAWPRALLHVLPDTSLREGHADRVNALRDHIYDDILPAINGRSIDAAQQPEFAYMPMPEDAEHPFCSRCGSDDRGMVLLAHTQGSLWVSAIVCRRHHDDGGTRAWLAQQH